MRNNIKKSSSSIWSWLIWWKISDDDLRTQTDNYHSLNLVKSYRGISVLLLCFSIIATIVIAIIDNKTTFDIFKIISIVISLILGIFIYRGQKIAIMIAIFWWTIEKLFQMYIIIETVPSSQSIAAPLVYWYVYIGAFYRALKVEQYRSKNISRTIQEVTTTTHGDNNQKLYCSNCGKELRVDSKFCNSCGSKVEINKKQDTIKDIPLLIVDKENSSETKDSEQNTSHKKNGIIGSHLFFDTYKKITWGSGWILLLLFAVFITLATVGYYFYIKLPQKITTYEGIQLGMAAGEVKYKKGMPTFVFREESNFIYTRKLVFSELIPYKTGIDVSELKPIKKSKKEKIEF
jgi:hypothetical protein